MNKVEVKVGQVWAATFSAPFSGVDGKKTTGYRITDISLDTGNAFIQTKEVKSGSLSVWWCGPHCVTGEKVYLPDNWTLIEDAVR